MAEDVDEFRRILDMVLDKDIGPLPTRISLLLDSLFELSFKSSIHATSGCAGKADMVWRVIIGALEPYMRILSQWVTRGRLGEDKYGEFFVRANEKAEAEQTDTFKQWKSMYTLQMRGADIAIPYALSQEAEHIIRFGKTVRVLQFWKSRNIAAADNAELYEFDLARIITEKLRSLTDFGKHTTVAFERAGISDCLGLAKARSIPQVAEVQSEVGYYDPYKMEFAEEIRRAAEFVALNGAGRNMAAKRGKSFSAALTGLTQGLNEAPFKFRGDVLLTGMMTIEKDACQEFDILAVKEQLLVPVSSISRPSALTSAEEDKQRREKEPTSSARKWAENIEHYAQARTDQTINKICEDIYETSVSKYNCESFFNYYRQMESAPAPDQQPHLLAKSIVEEAILTPLAHVYDLIGSSFSQLVHGDLKLKMHMEGWQAVYLMMDGHSMQSFLSSVLEKLEELPEKVKGLEQPCELFDSMHEVNNILRVALNSRSHLRDVSGNFSFVNKPRPPKSASKRVVTDVTYFERVVLKYANEFPLSVIICSDAEEKYNLVFQWLLKIKRANYALQNVQEWHRFALSGRKGAPKKPSVDTRLIHRFALFEREVGHFTRALESFVYTRAVLPNVHALNKEVLESQDFDTLVVTHLRILQKIVDCSLAAVLCEDNRAG